MDAKVGHLLCPLLLVTVEKFRKMSFERGKIPLKGSEDPRYKTIGEDCNLHKSQW